MKVVFHNKISESCEVGILEIPPVEAHEIMGTVTLTKNEKVELTRIKNDNRKKEIIGTRFLIRKMLGNNAKIFYDEFGKPHLKKSSLHISISHSHQYVAVIIDKKHSTGIDIQKITPKILRIKDKFLNRKELAEIESNKDISGQLHLYWGVKESIYKEHGKGNINFAEQILIEPVDIIRSNEVKATLDWELGRKKFVLEFKFFNGFMLVYIRDLANIVS